MVLLAQSINKVKRIFQKTAGNRRQFQDCLLHHAQVECPSEYHGDEAYGGWSVCPTLLSAESVVYSFGVGEDISFDLSLIEKYGLKVFAFDPTPKSIAWVNVQELPEQFHFFEYGIASYDGIAKFYPPENPDHVSHSMLFKQHTAHSVIEVEVKRLNTIIGLQGHRYIDILKMDIEGAEYDVIKDLVNTDCVHIHQLLIEFHHRFPNVEISQTIAAVELLNQNGYQIFRVSHTGDEYSFIRI